MTDPQIQIAEPQRIAILADIHGNTIALDAVLADIEAAGGVDAYWLLGDYVAVGFDPLGVMTRITRLPNAVFVRGNADRLVSSLSEMDPWTAEYAHDPVALPIIVKINRGMSWAAGALAAAGWLPWLAELALEKRFRLPDGSRALVVHASPGADDGGGIHPNLSDEVLAKLVAGSEADLVFVGHTHAPLDRQVDGVRVVNPGSIGNPVLPGIGACYALLTISPAGYDLALKEVAYDKEAAIAATEAVKHPQADYINSFMLGQRAPGWAQDN